MKLTIKKIELENFKRWKTASFDFDKDFNEFKGENGGGKTSIYEAFLYALGYELRGFEPRKDNEVIDNLITKVVLTLDIGGKEHTFERTNKPSLKYNLGVIKTKKEYVNIFCELVGVNEKTLEILLNTSLFNQDTSKWGWNDRLKILSKYLEFGTFTQKFASDSRYNLISNYINNGLTPSDILVALKNNKKSLEQDIINKNASINSYQDTINEHNYNFNDIQAQIDFYEDEIEEIKEQIRINENNELINLNIATKAKLDKLFLLQKAENQEKGNALNLANQLAYQNNTNKARLVVLAKSITFYNDELQKNDNERLCDLCGQKLPDEKIAEYKKNIEDKMEVALNEVDTLNETIKKLEDNIAELVKTKEPSQEILDLQNEIQSDREKAEKIKGSENEIQTLKGNLEKCQTLVLVEKQKLLYKEVNDNFTNKINNCKKELLLIANKKIENEQAFIQLQEYTKNVQEVYQENVHRAFGNEIDFKFFGLTKDGDYTQDCVVKRNINGLITTYYSMSLGERLKTDILVNLGLQKLFNVSLPIWLDNAQDMTDALPTMDNQVIKLSTSLENNISEKGEKI